MTNAESTPLLGLRMKPFRTEEIPDYDEALDRLAVMTAQEDKYRTRDYMGRRRKRGSENVENEETSDDEIVDPACREKMCEWSYRVCDHFGVSREIVAFAFSYLDRFIDGCSCDRTAFKLAAMTSLYIATKMLNAKQISIASLAELSRGEFLAEHISQMERIILQSLDYRMNPPTVHSFIQQLRTFFPDMDTYTAEAVHKRAMFYAELSIYDYCFVTEDRYQVAVAGILNALQDVEGPKMASHYQDEFLCTLNSSFYVEVNAYALEKAQARLWYLYGCSAQSQFDGVQPMFHQSESAFKHTFNKEQDHFAHSPVSVGARRTVKADSTHSVLRQSAPPLG